jgi:hypothetical protein
MKPPPKTVLFRALSLIALTLAVLSPKFRWSHRVRDPQIAVVWDASASMSETDTATGQTRWREALAAWKTIQRELPRNAAVRHFLLDSKAHPLSETELSSLTPDAGECVYGSLGQVLVSSAPRALFFFSDGRWSDEGDTPLGVPVFAIGVGGNGSTPDLAVEAVDAPPLAYAGLPVDIQAHITSTRPSSAPVRVSLYENGKRRTQSTVVLSSGESPVSLVFTPSKSGFSRCEVRADPLPGETRTANNVRRFSMDIQRNRLRTLYIAGRPGPHYHFLRAQLKNDPAVELVSFVVLRDPEDFVPYADAELSLIPFPTSTALEAQLPTFDVVILEDLSGVQIGLGEPFYNALEKWVQAGGGFLSIHEPAEFLQNGDQNQGALSRLDPWSSYSTVSGPTRFRLKIVDPTHPLLSLAKGETNETRWANLALLEGKGRFFSQTKPEAHVLAVEPVNGAPVLADRPLGKGHVIGMANKTSWRWALEGGRRGEGPADYQRFWENLVRWLAGTPGSGSLRLIRPEGPLSAQGPYEIRLEGPRTGVDRPRVWIVTPNGKRQKGIVRTTERGGEFAVEFSPTESGSYEILAEAGASNRDHMRLDVASGWDESMDTRPDFARLASMARRSGGEFVEAQNVPKKKRGSWLSSVVWESRPQKSGTGIVLGTIAMILLLVEWIVRRRRGLP